MARRSLIPIVAGMAVAFVLAACSTGGGSVSVDLPTPPGGEILTLSSPAFPDGGSIPSRHTCDGRGVAPLLQWSRAGSAAEYVLFMTDPDAPGGTFVHWVMYGIPPETENVGEGQGPSGARQGMNGFGNVGYGPPCPPPGDPLHHYEFTLYALSSARTGGLQSGATAEEVLKRISCCIQATGRLTGTLKR